jgi:hypothetical protein
MKQDRTTGRVLLEPGGYCVVFLLAFHPNAEHPGAGLPRGVHHVCCLSVLGHLNVDDLQRLADEIAEQSEVPIWRVIYRSG